ncbi:MAG TPA: ribbon-helix-helix domain-containing protein [Candidatus Limnocylindrales bacterium]|nr:ribbon-helix-helix domain-containing protein [Candidatus Limnocylindrales bacterium]
MRKTSVYLSADEAEGLRQLAVREARSQADLIREAIRARIGTAAGPRTFHSMAAGSSDRSKPRRWTSDEVYVKTKGG